MNVLIVSGNIFRRMRSRKSLVKEADRVFSLYVRKSTADYAGYTTCYVCGRRFQFNEVDAGHFISRRYFRTRWNRVNVWPECVYDNRHNKDHLIKYEAHLIRDFGADIIDALWEEARNSTPLTDIEIEDIIKDCKTKLDML